MLRRLDQSAEGMLFVDVTVYFPLSGDIPRLLFGNERWNEKQLTACGEEPNDEKGNIILDRFYLSTVKASHSTFPPQWLPSLHPPLPSLPLFPQSHPPPAQRTRRRPPANGSKLCIKSSAMIFSPISANTTCRRRQLNIIDGFVHPLHLFLL